MPRIALIGATGKDWFEDPKKQEFVQRWTPAGYEVVNFNPRFGTHSIESRFDEAYNTPFILEQVLRAAQGGFDAIVIDCACDPALEAARELVTTPVVGMMNSALHIALTLGRRFGIITVQGRSLLRCLEDLVHKEGLDSFCVGIQCLQTPVLEIQNNPKAVQNEITSVGRELVLHQNADVLVLGCTGLSHYMDIKEITATTGAPVIDPYLAGIWSAVALIEIGLSHSKTAYPTPPPKPVTEAPSLEGVFDEVLRDKP